MRSGCHPNTIQMASRWHPDGIQMASRSPPGAEDDERLADLRAWIADFGRRPGGGAVKARYGIGSSSANWLREQAAKPQLTLAHGGG
jgi:hypothetical protein